MKRIVLAFAILSLALWLFACNNEEITPAKVDILKVGKADCIVIDTGSYLVMIDTAEEENLDKIHDYMEKNGYSKIDTLILTHFDKDHIGGAKDIISSYNVERVIESSFSSGSQRYTGYHTLLEGLGISPIKLKSDYSFTYDSCNFEINVPKSDKYSTKESNNSSLVVSLKIGENKLLFCGDAMELRLKELIAEDIGAYDFVKLPYHGNYLENYREFLNMVKAKYGAITCSAKNPTDERVLALCEEYAIDVFETRYGLISVTADIKGIKVSQ